MKLCPCAWQEREKENVSVSDDIACACVTATPCSVPLDTIFHLVIDLSAAILLSDAFRHIWTPALRHPNLRLKHPTSHPPTTSPHLTLQCLNLLVSNNIWFWCSWLHQHSCAPSFVCFFLQLCGCPLSETQAESSWEICTQATRRPEGGIGRKWRRDFWLSQYNTIAGFNSFLIIHVVSE